MKESRISNEFLFQMLFISATILLLGASAAQFDVSTLNCKTSGVGTCTAATRNLYLSPMMLPVAASLLLAPPANAVAGPAFVRIACSNVALTDSGGNTWSPDLPFLASSSSSYSRWYIAANAVVNLPNTVDSLIVQHKRVSTTATMTYNFPLGACGTSAVVLRIFFVESFYSTAGKRVFSVIVNGQVRVTVGTGRN
jgi:hypothetical protein